MKLVIAEKPSVAKGIAKAIDEDNPFGPYDTKKGYIECNGYIVSWCFGHLLGLKEPDDYDEKWSGEWAFGQLPMIPDKWKFKLMKGCSEQYKTVKTLMLDNRVDEIICATDADREGECIFRYVYYSTGCKKPVKRLWITSLEDKAVKDGFSKLVDMSHYNSLFSAGFSRAKADWLIGMNGTRLFTLRYGTLLSVGRVQTPTLAMIVKRYFDVKNFEKEKYYTVDIDCGRFTAKSDRIDEYENADRIRSGADGSSAEVKEIREENKKQNPPKLYDLTTLQREANKYFGYTAAQTSEYAQKLYEAKLITYPRTDCQYITDDMENTAIQCVHAVYRVYSEFGTEPEAFSVKRCINNKKVEGHHAILPTEEIVNTDIEALPFGQKNILKLVSGRLITAICEPHLYVAVKVTVLCNNNEFYAAGKNVVSNGFKAVEEKVLSTTRTEKEEKEEVEDKTEDARLPELTEGQIFTNISAKTSEHWTSPPKIFTENTLLSAMERAGNENYDDESEKKGLGTPATRADIIEGLQKKKYIERRGKKIIPTEKGIELINVVPDEIKSPKTTAEWEMQLQQIERGRFSAEPFLYEIVKYVKELCINYSEKSDNSAFKKAAASNVLGNCPKCGAEVKNGKYGAYCTDRCGMVIGTVYGHKLTDRQVSTLLSGELISFTEKGRKTVVQPQFRENEYNGKISYQWVTSYKK